MQHINAILIDKNRRGGIIATMRAHVETHTLPGKSNSRLPIQNDRVPFHGCCEAQR